MSLEIPNAIAAAASATVTLLSIAGAAPVVRTFGLQVNGSVNVASGGFYDGEDTTEDLPAATPALTLWQLLVDFDPAQIVTKLGGYAVQQIAVLGPVPSLTGQPEIDGLEPGQFLLGVDAPVLAQQAGTDPEVGAAVRYGWAMWEVPRGGSLEGARGGA